MRWHYPSDEDDPPSSVNTNLAIIFKRFNLFLSKLAELLDFLLTEALPVTTRTLTYITPKTMFVWVLTLTPSTLSSTTFFHYLHPFFLISKPLFLRITILTLIISTTFPTQPIFDLFSKTLALGLLTIEHWEKNLVHHSMPVRVEASSKNIRHDAPIEWFD
jgi:hypothetical protein